MFDENVKTDVHLKVSSGEKPSNTLYWTENCALGGDVVLPEGVTSINSHTFSRSNINSIKIPESVTSIEPRAFWGCGNLTTINLPKKLTRIPNSVFANCVKLKKITIPNSVNEIGESAFSSAGLESITIPENVTEIGVQAFATSKLKEVIFLTKQLVNAERSGYNSSFWSAKNLEYVSFPNGFKVISTSSLKANFDLSQSTKYSAETMVSWFNAFADLTGSESFTFIVGKVNLDKLTDEQKNIALNKNVILK